MTKLLIMIFLLLSSSTAFGQNDISATAKAFLEAFFKKDFATAHECFSDAAKAQVPVEAMPQVLAQFTAGYGEFKSVKDIKKAPDGLRVLAVVEFENRSENIGFAFDEKGKINGFRPAPPENTPKYQTPRYAKPETFVEKDVTIGSGEWALPGTLTLPKGPSKSPAVVLIHGSGPQDRDETGSNPANKTFKDIAWGLATKGIAVLRFDKRTLVHGQKIVTIKSFTVKEESVDDAVLAVEFLRRTPEIDGKSIFVAGHSLGGMLIPRIGQRDKDLAGLVSLAGLTRKLEDTYLEQIIYLSSLDGSISGAEQKEIDLIKQQVASVKNLKSTDPPETPTLLSLPVAYWVDLNNYDPVNEVKKIKHPIFILQGESDYNVTMVDFAAWKKALGSRKNAAFRSYPNLNHSFMRTPVSKSTPQEEEKEGHVEEVVISDLAEWILKTARK